MAGSMASDEQTAQNANADGHDGITASEQAILARLEPDGLTCEGGGRQQQKSAQTRRSILEAAINCLAEKGYAHTTTKTVASMAGVSRGAMLHHYPTKRDLVEQATAYTFLKRTKCILTEVRQLTEEERQNGDMGVTAYWKTLQSVEYHAYLELCVAARSDKELHNILDVRQYDFEQVVMTLLPSAFPEWINLREELILAVDLTVAAMAGVLINPVKWRDTERAENVRKLLTRVISEIRTGKIRLEDL